ncbi:hypothetical protein AK812_SmicGene13942 [Symbiodinium microadriaticum]|uniref:Uncharacterized protein n=1 Tax=Symbiodinium microadriaticum TaxID=2951 RepID=A0A1Q9E6R8_SYMMI|nr:hypothetical protein AK812_SmicGene13942 [Symbiodinium microadriaticum]
MSLFFSHTPLYCQYERGPSAATAYVRAGGLGPGRKSAGRRSVEPAFILPDLMHGRFAGSNSDGVEGELEQRAGEGPLSCDSDDAAPARDSMTVRGVNSKLSSMPERKAIADDLYPARKGAGGRAGCSVVAERVKQTTTGAEPGRERQRKAQVAEEEHPELCGGDGDCCSVNRADCKAAGGVWPGLGQQQRSGAGSATLPAPETVSWLVVVTCLRWMSQLKGIVIAHAGVHCGGCNLPRRHCEQQPPPPGQNGGGRLWPQQCSTP